MIEVVRVGTDSSGRPVLMSPAMRDWWAGVVEALGWEPTIVQGAYMSRAGGGADASAGYHDLGGCLDLRTWDLPGSRVRRLVAVLREHAAAAWVRDRTHGGFDPHLHLVAGWDAPLSPGAAQQWRDYLAGLDGLASRGRDYHPRPDPLVIRPPEEDVMRDEDWTRLRGIIREEVREAVAAVTVAERGLDEVRVDVGDGKARRRLSALLARDVGGPRRA